MTQNNVNQGKQNMRIEPFLAAIALVAAGLAGAAEVPPRDDYAFGFPLQTGEDSEFFAVDLPLEVYQSVADPALRDAGVYNAEGRAVPRLFEQPEEEKGGPERRKTLTPVPLYGEATEDSEQLRLLLQRGADGTRLQLDADAPSAGEVGQALTAYLIDARDLDLTLEALEFEWQQDAEGLIATVNVDGSDDLQHWRLLGSGTLADLKYEGTRIEQRRVRLDAGTPAFLRVTWTDMPEGWRLKKVKGIHSGPAEPVVRERLTLEPSEAGEEDGEFLFDAQGFPPVDRIDLVLPDRNSVVRASTFYRLDPDGRWRLADNGVFYALSRHGQALQSPPAAIKVTRAGQWRVRIEAGMASQPVRLRLGWRPDRLLFVAQGQPPFELVTGRAQDRLDQFPQESQLGDSEFFDVLRKSGQPGAAILGAREDIRGAGQLTLDEGFGWKTLLLWLGMAGAVLLVAWMVLSLTREMRNG